jgi:hypothetical protein
MTTEESVNLTDKLTRKHIRLVLSKDGKGMWERWESKDKKKWIKTHESLSIDNVMTEKEAVKSRNYLNLFNLIFPKK